jgi:hypothetical protein
MIPEHKKQRTFTTEKNDYFNFAEGKGSVRLLAQASWITKNIYEEEKPTSEEEDEVDALALKAEEGRGDRRNVHGELHTSAEP